MTRFVLTILAALALTACPGNKDAPKLNAGETAVPGGTYDVRQAVSAALGCPSADIAWSIVEPACGSIADGLFTAPECGSLCVPGTAHVRGTGCGKVAEVPIEIAEAVTAIRVCPTEIAVAPGATVQMYAEITYSCPGHVEWSPSQPPVGSCP